MDVAKISTARSAAEEAGVLADSVLSWNRRPAAFALLYTPIARSMYRRPRISEVGVAQLRKDLRQWLARAQAGDEVVITDRGNPVARLTGVEGPTTLERLMVQGRVSQPRASRAHARAAKRVRGRGPASEYVVEDREARRH